MNSGQLQVKRPFSAAMAVKKIITACRFIRMDGYNDHFNLHEYGAAREAVQSNEPFKPRPAEFTYFSHNTDRQQIFARGDVA